MEASFMQSVDWDAHWKAMLIYCDCLYLVPCIYWWDAMVQILAYAWSCNAV